MKRSAVAAALAGLVMAMPAYAQTMTGIFTAKGDRVAAKPAKISFPKKITTLSLVNTMEFSRPGESLDSAAEYTADGGLKATVYIYRPGYPDAALAAFETDRIMPRLYGAAISRTSQAAVPLGGRATAIRISYKGAVLDGRPFATASAFARIGGWIVKLRVSGPADHQAEVDAALDALLSGAEIDKDAVLFSTAPLDFGPPCPATTSGTVKSAKGEKSGANALGSAIMAVTLDSPPKDKTSVPPPFPANGMTKVCSRGLVGQLEALQPVDQAKPERILVMLSDSGDVATVSKNLLDDNYTITRSKIGTTLVLGEIDRLPDNDELARIFSGGVPGALDMRVSVTENAQGNSTITMNPNTLK